MSTASDGFRSLSARKPSRFNASKSGTSPCLCTSSSGVVFPRNSFFKKFIVVESACHKLDLGEHLYAPNVANCYFSYTHHPLFGLPKKGNEH